MNPNAIVASRSSKTCRRMTRSVRPINAASIPVACAAAHLPRIGARAWTPDGTRPNRRHQLEARRGLDGNPQSVRQPRTSAQKCTASAVTGVCRVTGS